jgi:hypothetical protein
MELSLVHIGYYTLILFLAIVSISILDMIFTKPFRIFKSYLTSSAKPSQNIQKRQVSTPHNSVVRSYMNEVKYTFSWFIRKAKSMRVSHSLPLLISVLAVTIKKIFS